MQLNAMQKNKKYSNTLNCFNKMLPKLCSKTSKAGSLIHLMSREQTLDREERASAHIHSEMPSREKDYYPWPPFIFAQKHGERSVVSRVRERSHEKLLLFFLAI